MYQILVLTVLYVPGSLDSAGPRTRLSRKLNRLLSVVSSSAQKAAMDRAASSFLLLSSLELTDTNVYDNRAQVNYLIVSQETRQTSAIYHVPYPFWGARDFCITHLQA